MKTAIISSLFVIIAFTTAASAQVGGARGHVRVFDPQLPTATTGHVKVFDGRTGILLPSAGQSSEMPVIDLPAGKPIRIDIGGAQTGDERYTYVFSGTHVQVTAPEIPCGGSLPSDQRTRRGGHGRDLLIGGSGADVLTGGSTTAAAESKVFLRFKMSPVFVTSFPTSAGTCRMLSVKLSNGSEYRGVLRFR